MSVASSSQVGCHGSRPTCLYQLVMSGLHSTQNASVLTITMLEVCDDSVMFEICLTSGGCGRCCYTTFEKTEVKEAGRNTVDPLFNRAAFSEDRATFACR